MKLIREIRSRSVSSGLSTLYHLSSGGEEGILFHGMVESIAISMYFIPFDSFVSVVPNEFKYLLLVLYNY